MSYVIKRLDQGGGYLTPAGSVRTWTKDKAAARRFSTRDAAAATCCPENEIPEEL